MTCLGGTVTRSLGIIDAIPVEAPPSVAARLRADGRVQEVTPDAWSSRALLSGPFDLWPRDLATARQISVGLVDVEGRAR